MIGPKAAVGCCRCPNQCQYSSHRCEKVLYVITTKKVTKTIEGLRKEYEEVLGKKMTAEQIIRECTHRLQQVREQTLTFVYQARGYINKLNEIALKPEVVSAEAYIDLMIEAEKARSGEDQPTRIQALMELKDQESLRKRIAHGQSVVPDIPKTKFVRSGTRPGR